MQRVVTILKSIPSVIKDGSKKEISLTMNLDEETSAIEKGGWRIRQIVSTTYFTDGSYSYERYQTLAVTMLLERD